MLQFDGHQEADYQSIVGGEKNKLDIYTIDSIIYKYFEDYKKANNLKLEVIDNAKEKYAILSRCIADMSKIYSGEKGFYKKRSYKA